jgi:ElaB/YqjD/DUF883 family membrane-anchored ribosome-binding protein
MNEPSLSYDSAAGTPGGDSLQAAKASALRAAEELRAAAAQKAAELRGAAEAQAGRLKAAAGQRVHDLGERADEFREIAGETLGQARAQCEEFMVEAEKLAREKPRQALLTAFGLGLLVGLLLKR